MFLITSYYIPSNQERLNEINFSLQKNVDNEQIKKIVLLNNNIFDLAHINDPYNKITQIIISNNFNYRPKFSHFIRHINENYKNEICIIANSDIYFNDTLNKINISNITNKVLSLLRYDLKKDNTIEIFRKFDTHKKDIRYGHPRDDAQDSWIFLSPLNIPYDSINLMFGTPGCDNMFANAVYEAGLIITNPCYDIITIHVHESNYRTYTEDNRHYGKYTFVEPCGIDTISKIYHLVHTKGSRWRVLKNQKQKNIYPFTTT
jgi:hypothetical protein